MKKGFILSMAISIIAFVIAVWFVLTTKGDIPIHWNIAGEVDGYGSPLMMLIFPTTSILVTLLIYFLPKIDPKGENIKKSGPILPIIMVIIAFLMLGIEFFIIMAVKGSDIMNMTMFISLVLGVMFVVMGYYMPQVKHNYMLGIRTPWTLYSENIWVKTHEESKNWLIVAGLSYLACAFIKSPYNIIVPVIITMVVMVGLVVYSYLLFAEEKSNKKK